MLDSFSPQSQVSRTSRRGKPRQPARHRRVPRLVCLEDRLVLATLLVNSYADNTTPGDNFLTLREAILSIGQGRLTDPTTSSALVTGVFGSNDTVRFAPSMACGTIKLPISIIDATVAGPSAFRISRAMTLDGQTGLDQGITIARAVGAAPFRLFDVNAGGNLTLKDLTISGGAGGDGGAGGGSAGLGGSIFNRGTLTIRNSTLTGNTAKGGPGASGGPGNRDGGGGGGGLGGPGLEVAANPYSASDGAGGGKHNGGAGGVGRDGAFGNDGGFGGGGGGGAAEDLRPPGGGGKGGFDAGGGGGYGRSNLVNGAGTGGGGGFGGGGGSGGGRAGTVGNTLGCVGGFGGGNGAFH